MQESISFDKELREQIKETTITLAKVVKSTLGPQGTNVGVLSHINLPLIVNDGVTVAKSLSFKDPLKKFISDILKTVSQNTENLASDGTTTSITLTEAIVLEGLKYIDAGFSHRDIVKGIRTATLMVLESLDKNKLSAKDMLENISSISANNDKELGKVISLAFEKVGEDGQIEVEDSLEDKTYIEIVPGMKYLSGYESPLFSTNDKSECFLENPRVLLFEGKFMSTSSIMETIQDLRNDNRALFIVADDYDKLFVDDMASIKINHGLKVCLVKSPMYGEQKEKALEDIALVTNSKIISRRFGTSLESLSLDMLGETSSIKIDKDSFNIISSDSKEIDKKIDFLKKESLKETGVYKQELLSRIARLSNGVAILYVHGSSPLEISEKKYRIEDAIGATRAALQDGITSGGGIALLKLSKALKIPKMENESQEFGFRLLIKALEAPIKTISENSGENGEVVMQKVLSKKDLNYGFNAMTKEYGDMIEMGVIDPVKVTKAALVNASSVSEQLLMMNCTIYE